MTESIWSEEALRRRCIAVAKEEVAGYKSVELIRVGTNAVFLVHAVLNTVILRLSAPDYDREHLQAQIDLAGWLTEHGFPTSRPLSGILLTEDSFLATIWEYIPGLQAGPRDFYLIGRTLRAFHSVTNSYPETLPEWEPMGRLGCRLDLVSTDEVFTDDDLAILTEASEYLATKTSAMQFSLPKGPLHGDIHTGNIIVRDDQAVFLDFDRIAHGPREWDLTQINVSNRFFGTPSLHLDSFSEGYGYDLRTHEECETLINLRALFMTSWLLTLPRAGRVSEEIANRMQYWRNPADYDQTWHAI